MNAKTSIQLFNNWLRKIFRRLMNEEENRFHPEPTLPFTETDIAGKDNDLSKETTNPEEIQRPLVDRKDYAKASLEEILGNFADETWIMEEEPTEHQDPGLVISKIQRISKLPTLTGIADKFRQLSISPSQDIDDLAKLINADPSLTSQILKISRSAYYGMSGEESDIESSILLLGTERIKLLSSMLSSQSFLQQWDLKFKWRLLWMHSFATALLSARILDFFKIPSSPSFYTGALLHDIGKILLSYLYPGLYRTVLINAHESGTSLRELEKTFFGVDHEEAGGIFAKLNNFPEEVHAVIRFHSEPDQPEEHVLMVAAIQVANLAAQRFNLGYSGSSVGIHEEITSTLSWRILLNGSLMPHEEIDEKELDKFLEKECTTIEEEMKAAFSEV